MEEAIRQWPQFRIHHQVGAHGDMRRLDEEPEGKARLDFEPLDPVQPPAGEQDRIGLGHRGAGRQRQVMDASIHGLAFDDVQDAEREARQPWLAVHEGEHNQRRPVGEDMVRNPTANDEMTQALLGEDAGHDDEAEHHRQQQIEKVVPRIERSDPNRQGQQQESHAFRRQAQGPVAVEPAEELADALEPHEAYRGTGTDSTTSWMTRSASSERCPREPWLVFSITRCARTSGANSLMSSGRQYSRWRTRARALAVLWSAIAPRGLTPSIKRALRRVAAMMARRYSIRLSSSRTFSTRSCRSKASWVVSTASRSSAGCSNCARSSTFFLSARSRSPIR